MERGTFRIGTCSWNYDSWIGLVYSGKRPRSALYLSEYSKKFNTVEIDSWFYRMPSVSVVSEYLSLVPEDFRFTCKVPNSLTLTHKRRSSEPNPDFLSPEVFREFLHVIEPMLPVCDAMMFEFEYLNRQKMAGQEMFMMKLESFVSSIPSGLPLAVETRNKNYLNNEYFKFLNVNNLSHVFSEKIYMPPVTQVYGDFGDLLKGHPVIRLLGGDRKAIEKKTGEKWDNIVEPKESLPDIADMINELIERGFKVSINVNNHFEGSAPLTIDRIIPRLKV